MCRKLMMMYMCTTFSILIHSLYAQEQYIYWTNTNSDWGIFRGSIDGSSYEKIFATRQVNVFDAEGGLFYWFENGCILKKSINDANTDTLLLRIESVTDILVDLDHDKLYWNDYNAGKILQSDLNGLNIKEVIHGVGNPHLLKLDIDANTLYWIDDLTDRLQRFQLNGADIVDIMNNTSHISDFEIDTKNRKLFFVNRILDELKRMNMDGSEVEIVLSDFYSIDIELDPDKAHIYYSMISGIYYSDYKGSSSEEFINGLNFFPEHLINPAI